MLQVKIPLGDSTEYEIFFHFDIWDIVAELLLCSDDMKWDSTEKALLQSDEEREYSDIRDGLWWQNAVKEAEDVPNRKLLCLIVYTDGISPYFFQHTTLMPVMITLGNLPRAVQRSPRGKRLLGFIPHITERRFNSLKGKWRELPTLRRFLVHKSFDV